MTERLSAYELSLSARELAHYLAREAQQQWRLTKSAAVPYEPAQALEELLRRRPELYQRYQARVLQHEPSTDLAPVPPPPLLTRDEARGDLEALAKQYVSQRLVDNEADGLAMAIAVRPDLYAAFSRPAGASGAREGDDPLRSLQVLARQYVSKRLVADEVAGMERAIQERPDLYEAYSQQVKRSPQAGEPAAFRKVVR